MMPDTLRWAKEELTLAGYTEDAEEGPDKWLREGVLKLLEVFSDEGHSGASAPYAVSIFSRLASWKPLSPLTGAEDEWSEPIDDEGRQQSRRCPSVFREASGEAYDIDGIVFWKWYTDEATGEKSKVYFTGMKSRVPVTFPYTVPEKPEYREWAAEDDTRQGMERLGPEFEEAIYSDLESLYETDSDEPNHEGGE